MRLKASYAVQQVQLYGADTAGVVFNRGGAAAAGYGA